MLKEIMNDEESTKCNLEAKNGKVENILERLCHLEAKMEKLENTLGRLDFKECPHCCEYIHISEYDMCSECEDDICRKCREKCDGCDIVLCLECLDCHKDTCEICHVKQCDLYNKCCTCNLLMCFKCRSKCLDCNEYLCIQCRKKCQTNCGFKCRRCHFYDCTECWQPEEYKLLAPSLKDKIKMLLMTFKQTENVYNIPPRFIKYKIFRYFIKYDIRLN